MTVSLPCGRIAPGGGYPAGSLGADNPAAAIPPGATIRGRIDLAPALKRRPSWSGNPLAEPCEFDRRVEDVAVGAWGVKRMIDRVPA